MVIKLKILIRFGDLMLKGKNKKVFINKMNSSLQNKFRSLDVKFDFRHDQTYIDINSDDYEVVKGKLKEIPGIYSFSVIYKSNSDIASIVELSAKILNENLDFKKTFKIESRRSFKNFPLTSQELTKEVSPLILERLKERVIVDVRNPDQTLNINVRNDGTYIYLKNELGMDGFPYNSAGSAVVMLSGGIDSPVATYLAIKQGIKPELFHFDSSPMTPLESVQKVLDISKELARYIPSETIDLHIVPFRAIHEDILKNVEDSYTITIMRRQMFRLAEMFLEKNNYLAIISGESVGQVASQTLESLTVIEDVTKYPIIRPLITYDKKYIIKISKMINTYDVSIRRFEDCCSIYVPKRPVIKPTVERSVIEEEKLNMNLLGETLDNIISLKIKANSDLDITMHGFDFKDAYENYLKEELKW